MPVRISDQREEESTIQMTDELLFRREGRLGIITLNRPQVLNALNRSMCERLHRRLLEWAADSDIKAVLVEGAGDRAFCAGGDVVAVCKATQNGDMEAYRGFFYSEYRLNQAISAYPKPYIALVDGISMGGGVGVSIHGTYRIATERTLFAMPETGIGLIPDIGGTFALPRFPGEYGTWLGLTGARLDAADTLTVGYCTHYIPSDQISTLIDRLAHSAESIENVLGTFHQDPGKDKVSALRDVIDYAFSHNEVEDILDLLDKGDDWAQEQAKTIRSVSPTSLKLTLHLLRQGRHSSVAECLKREFRVVSNISKANDFFEGVRAQLIDKDRNPSWNPATLEEVDIEPYFEKPDWGDIDFD